MAKGHRDDDEGLVEFRLVEFKFKGTNASIQEGLRSITAALRTQREYPAALANSPAQPIQPALPEPPAQFAVEDEGVFQAQASENGRPKQGSAAKSRSRVPRSPVPVELDLESGDVPLQAFCDSKQPNSDKDRYLVIAYWLKQQRGITAVTTDLIYTCYNYMNWNIPRDPAQPLRDLKCKQKWFGKGEGRGEYVINHLGETAVKRMGS